jgi:hypothetical protein
MHHRQKQAQEVPNEVSFSGFRNAIEKFLGIPDSINKIIRRLDFMDIRLQQVLDAAQKNHDAAQTVVTALGAIKAQVAELQAQIANNVPVTDADIAAIDTIIDDATADLEAAVV